MTVPMPNPGRQLAHRILNTVAALDAAARMDVDPIDTIEVSMGRLADLDLVKVNPDGSADFQHVFMPGLHLAQWFALELAQSTGRTVPEVVERARAFVDGTVDD